MKQTYNLTNLPLQFSQWFPHQKPASINLSTYLPVPQPASSGGSSKVQDLAYHFGTCERLMRRLRRTIRAPVRVPRGVPLWPLFFLGKTSFFFANKKKKQKVEDDEKEGGGGGGEMIIKHKSRRFPNECSWLRWGCFFFFLGGEWVTPWPKSWLNLRMSLVRT